MPQVAKILEAAKLRGEAITLDEAIQQSMQEAVS